MAKDYEGLAPMVLLKMDPKTGEVDYAIPLDGPFGATNPLETFQKEAGAKGLAVIVEVHFISLDEFYGEVEEGTEENDGREATQE